MGLLNGNSQNKKVLVAGGAGYLGSVLVKKLLSEGYYVAVCDNFGFGRKSSLNGEGRLEVLSCDISQIPEVFLQKVAAVINLVALSNDAVCEMFPEKAKEVNVAAAVNLAKKAKAAGVKIYLFSSTCAVYGAGENLTEDSSVHPLSLYAKLKLEAEQELLRLANSNFSITIFRNATLFGLSPRMRFDLVVNTMTLSAFRKGLINIDGSGQQSRPLTHVADAASAFLLTLQTEPKVVQKQIFNIVSESKKVLEVAQAIAKVVLATRLEISGEPDGRSYYVDGSKARLLLGFTPRISIMEGVSEIFQALKNGLEVTETKVTEVYSKIFA